MYTARTLNGIVREGLGENPDHGHCVDRDADGRLRRILGREGGLVYLIERDREAQWFFVERTGKRGVRLAEVPVRNDYGGLLGKLEALGPGPARDAAAAARDLAGRDASRLADDCLGSWECREADALTGTSGAATHAVVKAARPTGHMRTGRDRLDPIGWATSLVPPGREVHPARIRRMLADGRILDAGMFRMLLGTPEDWYPASDTEWAAARGLARVLCGDAHLEVPMADLLGSFDFLDGVRGRWAEYMARGFPDVAAARDDVRDAVDMAVDFARRVVAPSLFRQGLGDWGAPVRAESPVTAIAAGILFGRKGLPAIVEASRRWHAAPQREDAPARVSRRQGWPVPFDSLDAPGGCRIVCLSRPDELADEGRDLRHCVGSYADNCATGKSVIVSVRDLDGRRLSTAELRRVDGAAFALVQHRGARNGVPPDEARMAVDWMLGAISAGKVAVCPRFAKHKWQPAVSTSRLYDAMDDGAFAREIQAWSRYLPRPLREPRALEAEIIREAVRVTETRYFGRPQDAIGYGCLLDGMGIPKRPSDLPGRASAWSLAEGAEAFFKSAFRRVGCGLMLDGLAFGAVVLAGFGPVALPLYMLPKLDLWSIEALAFTVAGWGALLFLLNLRRMEGPRMRRYGRWRRRADAALARAMQAPIVRTPRPEPNWRRVGWGGPQATSRG